MGVGEVVKLTDMPNIQLCKLQSLVLLYKHTFSHNGAALIPTAVTEELKCCRDLLLKTFLPEKVQ